MEPEQNKRGYQEVATLSLGLAASRTHPAVSTHTEAEGVLVGAACPIVHHALHGDHLPGLLGLAVEMASLLGWKGHGRVLVQSCLKRAPERKLPAFLELSWPAPDPYKSVGRTQKESDS